MKSSSLYPIIVLLGIISADVDAQNSDESVQIKDAENGKFCWQVDGKVRAGAHIIIAKCNKSSRNQKFKFAQGSNGDVVIEPGRKSNLRVVGIRDDKENRAWLRLAGKNSDDASNFDYLSDGKMAIDGLFVSSQGMKVDYGEPVMAIDSTLLDTHVAAPRSELIYQWNICSPLEEYDYCKYQTKCCPVGTKCYVKWEVWSGCLKSCTPGMTDGFDEIPWKCDLEVETPWLV
mmetsp:Transcript_12576/g.20941  ORF Transcript_12576/g.20941 Transcript_12576/m.20941 type:complete len:231 (-) Transcript_12576:173-865(-)|eukprot:CAMPEP_0197726620 /NCGR_PEP_ID=MMETSP1434-20131217/16462_1 /TAXON_ID=265543 /ORGANISM="Minutocellus polymorphus, Strain CCMP3303" /LENGTH=230 /DNA_ID=CAMNT_0043312609 /DNA_START=146 /DNA_END=838 /DNA_ORIENTATION=-